MFNVSLNYLRIIFMTITISLNLKKSVAVHVGNVWKVYFVMDG